MPEKLSSLSARLLDAAVSAGAEAADAIVSEGTSVSIDVRGERLEQAERSEGLDLGLRVIVGQRQACVSASETSDGTLASMAERAVAMAREAPVDPYVGLAEPEELADGWDIEALDLEDLSQEPDPAALEQSARSAEAAAMSVSGVTKIDAASAGFARSRFHLAATNGFSGGYSRTSHSVACVAISGEGTEMERDYCADRRVHAVDLDSPSEIGRKAGERASARSGSRKPPTGAYPVIYHERVAGSLIGHLLQAVNGTSITRGSSWLRDAMGTQVLPDALDLTEDSLRPRVIGSRPFDGEGLASRQLNIVENGILTSWILDLATARQLGLRSTANAARGLSFPPGPSAGNVALTQGEMSREELVAEIGTGLLVTSMMGSSINPTTGDYSRGAAGFWIEGGELAYPVNECTIAGNLRDMLKSIVPANDARTYRSSVVPSLAVEGLTLAGG